MDGQRAKTFRELTFKWFGRAFIEIDAALYNSGIDFYLTGTAERDYLIYGLDVKPKRTSVDTDFFIVLPEKHLPDKLRNSLRRRGFVLIIEREMRHGDTDAVIDIYYYGYGTVDDPYLNLEIELCFTQRSPLSQPMLDFVTRKVTSQMGLFVLALSAINRHGANEWDMEELTDLLAGYNKYVIGGWKGPRWREFHEFVYTYPDAAVARLLGRDLRALFYDNPPVIDKLKVLAKKQLKNEEGTLRYTVLNSGADNAEAEAEECAEILAFFIIGLRESGGSNEEWPDGYHPPLDPDDDDWGGGGGGGSDPDDDFPPDDPYGVDAPEPEEEDDDVWESEPDREEKG